VHGLEGACYQKLDVVYRADPNSKRFWWKESRLVNWKKSSWIQCT